MKLPFTRAAIGAFLLAIRADLVLVLVGGLLLLYVLGPRDRRA